MNEKSIFEYCESMNYQPFPKLILNDDRKVGIYGLDSNFTCIGNITNSGVYWTIRNSEGSLICSKEDLSNFNFSNTFLDFVNEFLVPLRIKMEVDKYSGDCNCMLYLEDELPFKSLEVQLEELKNELNK